MATVQKNILKLQLTIDAFTKDGQRFQDSSAAVTITGAADNGAGLVRVTAANHNFQTGNRVYIIGVTGTIAASTNNTASNPYWVVTRISSSTFDLVGSSASGSWSSGGTATGALVGSTDGAKFPRQRLLDMYNQSRMVLFNSIYKSVDSDEISKYVYGSFLNASIAIASVSGGYRAIPKPTGYVRLVGMTDGAATPVPIIVLPNNLLQETKRGTSPYYTVSATNLLAFEMGVNWNIVGNFGTSPASVDYYGITDWTLADVLAGTAVEVFSADVEYMIIEIAQAISEEQGEEQINALALKLLGKGN